MIKTLIHPKALLSNIVGTKVQNNNDLSFTKNFNISSDCLVGVFASHRDVRVVIEELQEVGFDLGRLILVARNGGHHVWSNSLIIYDYFPEKLFVPHEIARNFLKRLFRQGKYLLLVTGDANDFNSAGVIMNRRRGHAEVWYFRNGVITN